MYIFHLYEKSILYKISSTYSLSNISSIILKDI